MPSTSPKNTAKSKATAKVKADAKGEAAGHDKKSTSVPKVIQPYRSWNPELGSAQLPGSSSTDLAMSDDLVSLVITLKQNGSSLAARTAAADAICTKCKECDTWERGEAVDLAAAHGGIEAALQMFRQSNSAQNSAEHWNPQMACQGAEVLWWLADDYDHCQELIRLGGHGALIKTARERAPNDANVAASVFKVLSNSLYSEARNADLWRAEDISFLIEALAWVLGDPEVASNFPDGQWSNIARNATGAICDVAALWLQRADSADVETVRHVLLVVPRLLERMGEQRDDPVLMQHGCRLLAAVARRCKAWPADMRESTMIALTQILMQYQDKGAPEIKAFCMMALMALQQEVMQAMMDSQEGTSAGGTDGADCLHGMD